MARNPQNAEGWRDMTAEAYNRWQRFIRIQQIRTAHALRLAGERAELGPQSRKNLTKD